MTLPELLVSARHIEVRAHVLGNKRNQTGKSPSCDVHAEKIGYSRECIFYIQL